MASNFTELKAEICAYTRRVEADMPVASFIAQAESELQPIIRHYAQETIVTLTSDGVNVTFPTDFIDARRITIDGEVLEPVSIYASETTTGKVGYIRVGIGIQLVGTDGTDQEVKLVYRARFAPLSVSNATNWLITKFPNVYLHATLARAYHFLKNPEGVAEEKANLGQAIQTVTEDNRLSGKGGNQLEITGW